MKFILNESAKFILDEKFVLTEGETILVEAPNSNAKILQKLKDLQGNASETKLATLVSRLEELQKLEGEAQLKDDCAEVIKLLTPNKFNTTLGPIIEKIKNPTTYKSYTDEQILSLHNICDALVTNISKASQGLNNLTKIEQPLTLVVVEKTKLPEAITKIKDALVKFYAWGAKETPKEEPKEVETTAEVDWEQEYKNCKSAEEVTAFWGRYFEQEWDNNEDIISLRDIIAVETKEYGWTAIANPFINFLKNHYKGCLDQSKPTVKGKYTELHNAVVNRLVSEADLRGTGKLKEKNIIFNPNLYKVSARDMEEYLSHQREIISNAQSSNKYSTVFTTNPGRFLNNIMLSTGDVKTLVKDVDSKDPLRSLTEIKKLKATLFPEVEDIIDQEVVSGDFIDEVIKKVTSEELAKKLLAFLSISLRSNYGNTLDKVNNKLKVSLSSLIPPSYDQIENYYSEYKLGAKYTPSQAEKLLLGLAKVANLLKA